jgi:hypothetical protein
MKRREFFKTLSVVGITASIPVLATTRSVSARERLDAAIDVLKAAATKVYPHIENWTAADDGAMQCALLISGVGKSNPYPEPVLSDEVTGTDALAKWHSWESVNRGGAHG